MPSPPEAQPAAPTQAGDGAATTDVTDLTRAVLAEIARKGELPTVAKFMNDVLAATRAPSTPTNRIVDLVLQDVSLTNSILRLVNSAYYRRSNDRAISTISRAVVLLGVDAVTNIALGLNVFEHFADRAELHDLKRLMIRSLLTAIHAAELTNTQRHGQGEEAFVCGLLHDLGRLAVTFYVPDKVTTIDRLIATEHLDEDTAWRQVIGAPAGEFGQLVGQAWRLPDNVCDVIGSCGHADLSTTGLGLAVGFGRMLTDATMLGKDSERAAALKAVQERFAEAVPLSPKQFAHVLAASGERLRDLSAAFRISRADLERAAPALVPVETAAVPGSAPVQPAPGTTEERQRVFVHFMEEIALALARGCPLNDLFMMILEGMYRGIGCSQVVLTLLTQDRARLRARFAVGASSAEIIAGFQIPLDPSSGRLREVVTAKRELYVEAEAPPDGVPPEFVRLLDASYWMLLPIDIGSPAIGAFYVGRAAGDGPFTLAEQRSLRTLANYAVLAVRQSRAA